MQLLGILLSLTGTPAAPTPAFQEPAAEEACVVCHGEQGQQMKRSVHAEVGISCTDCHGGAQAEPDFEDPHGEDLASLREPRAAVESCGGCHSDLQRMRLYGQRTDQLALYWTSAHGKRLAEGDGARVATCVSCHGVHEVFKANDPRSPVHPTHQVDTCSSCHADPELMGTYGMNAEQPEVFRHSVHGEALLERDSVSSPACADCHGSHGAVPPGVAEVGQVCGSCHTVVREYFEGGPHMAVAQAGEMQECVSCHGHHGVSAPSSELFTGSGHGSCTECHAEADSPGARMATTLQDGLARLDSMISETEDAIEEAAVRGLFIESENGYLDDARGLRARAKALTHALSPEALQDLENRCAGMIGQVEEGLGMKYRGLRDRKIFTAIFLGIVTMLSGVLLVYRREIAGGWEKRVEFAPGAEGASPAVERKGSSDA